MKYSVEMYDSSTTLIGGDNGLTRKAAVQAAKYLAHKYPANQVFVTWFRATDQQHGYLNPSGDHAIIGEAY